jgi:hypothetical protein
MAQLQRRQYRDKAAKALRYAGFSGFAASAGDGCGDSLAAASLASAGRPS